MTLLYLLDVRMVEEERLQYIPRIARSADAWPLPCTCSSWDRIDHSIRPTAPATPVRRLVSVSRYNISISHLSILLSCVISRIALGSDTHSIPVSYRRRPVGAVAHLDTTLR